MTTLQTTLVCLGAVGFAVIGVIVLGARTRPGRDHITVSLARGVCPIHPDKPADGSECTCTWLLPRPGPLTNDEQAESDQATDRMWAEVLDGDLLDEYPQWRRNLDAARRARAGDPDSINAKGDWRI